MAGGMRAEDIPTHVRGLAELLARQPRIDAAAGKQRVELLLEGGRLVEVFVHERISGRELEDHPVEVVTIPPASP